MSQQTTTISDSELVDKLIEFSTQAVLDHMQSLYEEYPQYVTKHFFSVATYRPLVSSITSYYNTVCTTLLQNTDEELSKKISMLTGLNHRETCLLSIMLQLSLSFLHVVMEQHHTLDKSTVENYITDAYNAIMDHVDIKKEAIVDDLKKMHGSKQCATIELCNCTDKPLFDLDKISPSK